MTRSIRSGRGTRKNEHFPKGKQNFPSGNQISPLINAIKDLLPEAEATGRRSKADWALHTLTGAGLSTCQKVLSGHRQPNDEMILALLRSPLGWPVLKAIMAGSEQPWFAELEDLADIAQLKRDQIRMKRDLDRREQRLLEAGGR